MYLFIDVETTGLQSSMHSLLTISMQLVPRFSDDPIAEFIAKIKHSEYIVSPEALEVNKIDLIAHHKAAHDIEKIRQDFHAWLASLYTLGYRNEKLIIVGYNVGFDMGFIHDQFFTKKELSEFGFHYVPIDVASLVEVAIDQGKIPPKRRLVDVARHFGLDVSGAHDASYDNYLCRKVVQELIKL